MKLSRGLSLILLLVAPAVTAANAQGIDLTGLWEDGSGGGGVYRVRQMGTRLYWIVDGTSRGSYVNMMFGEIAGNMMHGKWVDLPGSPTLGGGDISMRIESNNRFVKISSSTHYAPHTWTRLGSAGGDVIPPGRAGRYLSVRLNGRLAVVDWSNAPTASGSWVSIVPVGTSDGAHAGRWVYTGNTASGRYENGPLDPGAYEARFYADAGYGQLVDRVRFELGAETPPVIGGRQGQIMRVQVDGGPNAIVTWSNAPTSAGAWVSVVPIGTAESTHIGKWTYTNQTAAGRYEAGPLSPGAYEARFYADGGYGQLVERVRFEVGAQFLRITGETPDISGTWNYGSYVYNIIQKGSTFTWKLAAFEENAEGTIKGKSVSANVKNINGSKVLTGTVTQVDGSGRATRIEWGNGVVFTR